MSSLRGKGSHNSLNSLARCRDVAMSRCSHVASKQFLKYAKFLTHIHNLTHMGPTDRQSTVPHMTTCTVTTVSTYMYCNCTHIYTFQNLISIRSASAKLTEQEDLLLNLLVQHTYLFVRERYLIPWYLGWVLSAQSDLFWRIHQHAALCYLLLFLCNWGV